MNYKRRECGFRLFECLQANEQQDPGLRFFRLVECPQVHELQETGMRFSFI